MAILGSIDVLRRRTEDRNAIARERECQIIRNLSAGRDNDALRFFEIRNIQNAFERKLFEIQAIGHIVVGRNCLRIGIDHDRVKPLFFERLERLHARPVELDR